MTKRKWLIISMLFLLIIAVNTVSFVYAYFYKEANVPNTELNFGQVDVSSLIYFENGTELIDPINVPTRDNQSKQGIYYVNISDLDNPYYINKLRVDFNIESTVETYFRVKIVDTLTIVYEKANGDIVEISVPSESTENINYQIDSNNWYHDQKSDWYYYKNPVTKLTGLIKFIESGLQYPVHRDEYQIQIAVIIEAVQADGGPLNNWFEPVKPWNKENWK